MDKIYIISWNNESGDSGLAGYFLTKPTKEQVEQYLRNMSPHDFEDGNAYISGRVVELSLKEI